MVNTQFCRHKYGRRCPQVSLKTPRFVTTNTEIIHLSVKNSWFCRQTKGWKCSHRIEHLCSNDYDVSQSQFQIWSFLLAQNESSFVFMNVSYLHIQSLLLFWRVELTPWCSLQVNNETGECFYLFFLLMFSGGQFVIFSQSTGTPRPNDSAYV